MMSDDMMMINCTNQCHIMEMEDDDDGGDDDARDEEEDCCWLEGVDLP